MGDEESSGRECLTSPRYCHMQQLRSLPPRLQYEIDTHCIVVNQVLFAEAGGSGGDCGRCVARMRMQRKYLDQICDLYEDFHVVRTPLLNEEVRGHTKLRAFSRFLTERYDPNVPLPGELSKGCAA